MGTRNEQTVQTLQELIGYLECEFLYLSRDINLLPMENRPELKIPSAKLALAAFCVERASCILQENDVVTLLLSQLDAPTPLTCASVS